MTQYTTRPETVEAMQWLGPDDPAHVSEFLAWAGGEGSAGTSWLEIWGDIYRSTPIQWFVAKEDGELSTYDPDDFHARYTPSPDVEDAG